MKIFNKKSVNIYLSVLLLLFAVNTSAAPIPKAPNPDVKSYILIDYDSGMVIAEKNSDLILPPAEYYENYDILHNFY